MKKQRSINKSPKYLYRFFKKKEYRDQFLKGSIRFGRLKVYQDIEDENRRDSDEGQPRGKYRTDKQIYLKISNKTGKVVEKGFKTGDIDISGYSPNIFFIACLSDKNVDLKLLSGKFGRYVVKINDPQKLVESINKKCKFLWNVGRILLEGVIYDKDKYILMEKNNPHLPVKYYYAQKSEVFANEHEWRIVLTGSAIEEINQDYVTIEIGSIENIASSIDLDMEQKG